jgi:predicted Zn-dependent peptidase
MRVRHRIVPLLLALGILLTGGLSASLLTDTEKSVTEFQLPNGIHFIILERHQVPVVSFVTHVDVGSVNEVIGTTGVAHVFEHMAFKGTTTIGVDVKKYPEEKKILAELDQTFAAMVAEKKKVGGPDLEKMKQLQARFDELQATAGKYVKNNEFVQILEKNGGEGTNAGTSTDSTVYFINVPSNKVELWAWLESERLIHPVLREFYKEKNVIMEERRQRTESNPIGRLIEEVQATAFKAHPYKEPVIGHMSDIQATTADDARAFHDKYYVGHNITICIVGDVYPAEIKPLVEKYFSTVPAGEAAGLLLTQEPPQVGEKRITIEDLSQPVVVMAYHKPDIRHPDSAVYDVIQDILAGGKSSRLYEKLVKKDQSALFVGAFPGFPGTKYPNLFLFFGVPNSGRTNEEIEKAIQEEIERLKTEPVTDEELKAVQTKTQVGLFENLLSNAGMAQQLAYYQVVTGDWRNLLRQVDKIQNVTKEDIQRVAKECFQPSNLTVGTIVHAEPAAAK